MAKGHFIRLGDETTCGGKVLDADTRVMMFGIAHAREGDRVSCGKKRRNLQDRGRRVLHQQSWQDRGGFAGQLLHLPVQSQVDSFGFHRHL
jgi:hypothetical protein